MFNRIALRRLIAVYPESDIVKMEELLDDPELFLNYAQQMIYKRHRLDLVEEKILREINADSYYQIILEEIVRSSFYHLE